MYFSYKIRTIIITQTYLIYNYATCTKNNLLHPHTQCPLINRTNLLTGVSLWIASSAAMLLEEEVKRIFLALLFSHLILFSSKRKVSWKRSSLVAGWRKYGSKAVHKSHVLKDGMMGTISLLLCFILLVSRFNVGNLAWQARFCCIAFHRISSTFIPTFSSVLLAMMPQDTVLSQQRNASKRAFSDLLLSFASSMLAFDIIGMREKRRLNY